MGNFLENQCAECTAGDCFGNGAGTVSYTHLDVYKRQHFYRIPDHTALAVENNREAVLETGHTYTAVTYNVGFGAYGPDYSFFMDTGEMKDGTKTQGIYGKAVSREDTEKNTSGSVRILNDLNADFMLLQEVDEDADRSYHLNQVSCLKESFPDYSSVFVNNFHTAYLLYPFSDPHGAVQAGLLNFSRYKAADAIRRSYPVDDSFITKFTDLDRCFSVMRFPVKDGKELVLVNSHMSAYDEGGKIRVQQLELLNSVMAEEYEAGNYVIVGGDFNHAMGEAVAEGFATCLLYTSLLCLQNMWGRGLKSKLPGAFHRWRMRKNL